jgi:hypothetical protein
VSDSTHVHNICAQTHIATYQIRPSSRPNPRPRPSPTPPPSRNRLTIRVIVTPPSRPVPTAQPTYKYQSTAHSPSSPTINTSEFYEQRVTAIFPDAMTSSKPSLPEKKKKKKNDKTTVKF